MTDEEMVRFALDYAADSHDVPPRVRGLLSSMANRMQALCAEANAATSFSFTGPGGTFLAKAAGGRADAWFVLNDEEHWLGERVLKRDAAIADARRRARGAE